MKVANSILAARHVQRTINQHFTYAQEYRLETTYSAKDFVFDEVGFVVSTRPKRGRPEAGKRAIIVVPYAKSGNISIVVAMNKNMKLYFKVHDHPVKAVNFQACLTELKTACTNTGIETPILVLDNTRIHHAQTLHFEEFEVKHWPPYRLLLNPIENCFHGKMK